MIRSTLLTATLMFGIQFGWQEFRRGETEYIVQLDEDVIAALRAGEPITSDLPPQLTNVTRIRIQYGKEPLQKPKLPHFVDPGEARANEAAGAGAAEPGIPAEPGVPAESGGQQDFSRGNERQNSNGWAQRLDSPSSTAGSDWQRRQDSRTAGSQQPGRQGPRGAAGDFSGRSAPELRPPTRVPREADERFRQDEASSPWWGDELANEPRGVAPLNDPLAGGGQPAEGNQISPVDDPLGRTRSPAEQTQLVPGPIAGSGDSNSPQNLPNRQNFPVLGDSQRSKSRLGDYLPGFSVDESADPTYGPRSIRYPALEELGQNETRGQATEVPWRANPRDWRQTEMSAIPWQNPRSERATEDPYVRQADAERPAMTGGMPPAKANERNESTRFDDESETSLAGQPGGNQAARENAVDTDEEPKAGAGTAESTVATRTASDPWLMTLFLLCLSLGGNLYLGWVARGAYLRYRELADAQRRANFERMMLE